MTIIFAALLAVQAAAPSVDSDAVLISTLDQPAIDGVKFRKARPEEVRSNLEKGFAFMDKDHSGFIERDEAPVPFGIGAQHAPGTPNPQQQIRWVGGAEGQALWIARGDTDGDGKLSVGEYIAWFYPLLESRGIPETGHPEH